MIVSLPWPDKRLSPNARQHWGALASVKKKARADANLITLADLTCEQRRDIAQGDGKIPMAVVFYPPDNRRRDYDNMVASAKAALDGVADALLVDDRRFRPAFVFGDPVKPGRIDILFPNDLTRGGGCSSCDVLERERPDAALPTLHRALPRTA